MDITWQKAKDNMEDLQIILLIALWVAIVYILSELVFTWGKKKPEPQILLPPPPPPYKHGVTIIVFAAPKTLEPTKDGKLLPFKRGGRK